MTRISFALLTHDEHFELERLMGQICRHRETFHEVVIVDDFSDERFASMLERHAARHDLQVSRRRLDRDFATQRNHLKSRCSGDYVFVVDPDEYPTDRLLRTLPQIVGLMERNGIEACSIPRFNIPVTRPVVDPVAWRGHSLRGHPFWESHPRLFRNLARIDWRRRLDEYLAGFASCYVLPHDEETALLHCRAPRAASQQLYRSMKYLSIVSKLGDLLAKVTTPRTRPFYVSLDV